MKVKQPWAQLLVEGRKDCENRTWRLTPSTGFPAWVLIVASKQKSTRREYADAQSRLEATGQVNYRDALMSPTLGCIVGAVKIHGCYAADSLPWPTVWHNAPDFGWMISDSVAFDSPIPIDDDDKFQIQVSLGNRPQYRDRVMRELTK